MLASALAAAQSAGTAVPGSAQPGTRAVLPTSLPPEAPSSLFEAKLGGLDAELLVRGSWQASLFGTTGIQAIPGGGLQLARAQPILFTQHPDLFLSFLLFKKLFVEARVTEDVSQALYSVGYRGGEEDTLKELRVGNDKISFPDMPFLSFGVGSYRSFGASALAASGNFEGRAMVRYDQADRVTKRFVGSAEVTDADVSPASFIPGKYFATESRPVTNLLVYVQSTSGSFAGSDGLFYRRLDQAEYSYSSVTGLVQLASAAKTRVVGTYNEVAGGFAHAGSPVVSIGGRPTDLLYDPDFRSGTDLDPALQVLSRYATTASSGSAEAFVRDTASGLRDPSFEARIDDSGFIEILHAGSAGNPGTAAGAAPSAQYMRPFEASPAAMDWLYTTDFSSTAARTAAPVYTKAIVVRTFATSEYITVDKDVIASSVEVLRNGVPDFAFSVDTDNGRLSLASPPGLAEEIDVSYLRETSERRAGSLAAAVGGTWKLGEDSSAWAALGLRWALPGTSYAQGGVSNPGTVTFTVGEKDSGSRLKHSAAVAASYTQDEASGRYRIEGMEAAGTYTSSFRPTGASDAAVAQVPENELGSRFPQLVDELHRDGSTQMALRITAGASLSASIYEIVDLPPYPSFKQFSFFVRTVANAAPMLGSLRLQLDDGSLTGIAVAVDVPIAAVDFGKWRKIVIRYGDLGIYVQDSDGGPLSRIGSLAATFDSSRTASRILLTASGLSAGQELWVDELLLEESNGRAALMFRGELSYAEPGFSLGPDKLAIMSGIDLQADAAGAIQDSSFAAGGLSFGTALGPLAVAAHARGSAAAASRPALSGGHDLVFPRGGSPLRLEDRFDFNPQSGAFGREDSVSLNAGSAISLSARQRSAWTPSASSLEFGLLDQLWEGRLGAAANNATVNASVANRVRPGTWSDLPASYGQAWFDAYRYALPAFESDSERREEKIGAILRAGEAGEFASATMGSSVQPDGAGGGSRQQSATTRATLPLDIAGLKVAPYYQRSWRDQRLGSASSLAGDFNTLLDDLSAIRLAYTGVPFAELGSAGTRSAFADQSRPGGIELPSALYAPEAGINLSRDFGSNWYDLFLPSSLGLARRRELQRSSSVVSDSAILDSNMKFASLNLFGAEGAYPLGLPFDSDEYFASIQATLTQVVGEGSERLKIQAQHLATFYAGEADRLDAENRLSFTTMPGSSSWDEKVRLASSRRVERHWLLDLYRMTVAPRNPASVEGSGPAGAAAGGDQGPSLVSLYLEDLKQRTPNMRSIFELDAELSRAITDATKPGLSWSFAESYEAKLTVPERLTVSVKGALSQSEDGTTGIFEVDLTLSLALTVSF